MKAARTPLKEAWKKRLLDRGHLFDVALKKSPLFSLLEFLVCGSYPRHSQTHVRPIKTHIEVVEKGSM